MTATVNDLYASYDALTAAAERLLAEIARENPETMGLAIEQFTALNSERIRVMRLLNLVPAGM